MTALADLPILIGRYALFDKIASGGMASVFLGRMSGAAGLSRTVAIKRLHPHLAENPDLAHMLLDEARITMRIRHPNVVPTIDVTQLGSELLIVMEYVVGPSLAHLVARAKEAGPPPPPAVAASIVAGVLHGLHAAHEASDTRGEPLGVVHRDVSPQNILVGVDGTPRVLDFGIAKAAGRVQSTQDGKAKGKLAYMAPEQLETTQIDRRVDVFAAGIVLWELLTLERLFAEPSEALTIAKVFRGIVPSPSTLVAGLDPRFDAICARALARAPAARYATAREMALDLEACATVPASTVAAYVERLCGDDFRARSERVHQVELAADEVSGERTVREPTPAAGTRTAAALAAATLRSPEPMPAVMPEQMSEGAPEPMPDVVPTLLSITPPSVERPAAPSPPAPPARASRWPLALLAMGLALAAVVAMRLRTPSMPAPQAAITLAPAAPAAPATSTTLGDSPVITPTPAAAASAGAGGSAPATAPAEPSARTLAVRPVAVATRPHVAASVAPSAKPKCQVVPVTRPDGTTDFIERCP